MWGSIGYEGEGEGDYVGRELWAMVVEDRQSKGVAISSVTSSGDTERTDWKETEAKAHH